jgi:photosystem II stability/assembly factor-like uncharacterized protein
MDTRTVGLAFLLTAGRALAIGQSWTQVPVPPEAVAIAAIEIDPANPSVIHIGAGPPLFSDPPQGPAGTFRSTDAGLHWSTAIAGRQTRGIARDPSLPARMYAAMSDASFFQDTGLFRSTDGGATWTSVAGLPSTCCSSVAVATDGAVYAGDRDTIWRSSDGGSSWSRGLGLLEFTVRQIAIDPRTPSILYATTVSRGPSPTGGLGEVFKSSDAGQTWVPVQGGFPFGALAVDPLFTSTVYASSGLVYRSTNGGTSWTSRFPPGGNVGPTALLTDPERPLTVYAGTGTGVYRSIDAGETWSPLGAGSGPHLVYALAMDRSPQRTLYASSNDGLFRIDTAGVPSTCTPALTGLCLQGGRFLVEVAWQSPGGIPTPGQVAPITANTGAFWFFSPDNLELVVKVLDGRSINGKWWIFYGALSNVEYTITVTDTQTGALRTYFNPQGQLASVADTGAF